ncbi:MAG: hypothetical protein AAF564_13380 [Bacteroidota bacterium]
MKKSELEIGRSQFRQLLLTNPNYFGTNAECGLKLVQAIQQNTKYEEIGCVGYDPKFDRLEAVVYINQPFGYGGDICSAGTPEYVRFYLSFDNGGSWEDQGLVSFRAYNIPEGTVGTERLEYAVSLPIDGMRRFCAFTGVVLCRAILSWNNAPAPDTPDFIPVWGGVHDTHLLTEPYKLITVPGLFEAAQIDIPDVILTQVDAAQQIKLKEPVALSVSELAAKYAKLKVQPARFAFQEAQKLLNISSDLPIDLALANSPLGSLDIDISDIILPPPDVDGNTTYEELECVGLYPNEDLLVGTFRVKRSAGYSGGPCTAGSTEYVTFWGDFNNNGIYEKYLGTASVKVYDYDNIPEEGLEYAVTLPVDLSMYRQPCEDGPRLAGIRAILSWNQPPDPTNPNYVPVWGNREETTVHIAPGPDINAPGAYISIMGGIPVGMINDVSGETTADALFALNGLAADNLGRPCPFGGRVVLQGPQFQNYKYRVSVREIGTAAWTPVTNRFLITNLNGIASWHEADIAGMFTFPGHQQNITSTLAWWNSSGDERFEVRLEVFDPTGTVLQGVDVHVIQLDNTGPSAEIDITSGAGNCGKFQIGDTISGIFKARDENFGGYSITVLPTDVGANAVSPANGTVQTSIAGNSWSLDTTDMIACGYVVRLVSRDRAIVNSIRSNHRNPDEAGFCLDD